MRRCESHDSKVHLNAARMVRCLPCTSQEVVNVGRRALGESGFRIRSLPNPDRRPHRLLLRQTEERRGLTTCYRISAFVAFMGLQRRFGCPGTRSCARLAQFRVHGALHMRQVGPAEQTQTLCYAKHSHQMLIREGRIGSPLAPAALGSARIL